LSLKKRSKIALIFVASVLVLTGCTSAPEPKPTATATEKPEVVRPVYDAEAAGKLPFTINGVGNEDITIDFPAGFKEPSIVTMSATGEASLTELDYDGKETDGVLNIRAKNGGTVLTIKYPTEESPSRTTDFRVEAEDDVSWAISAEALGSVEKLQGSSVSGTSSRVFMLDVEANTIDFITKGVGATDLYLVQLDEDSANRLQGGNDDDIVRSTDSGVNTKVENFAGYIFVVVANNPDTQGWEILFSEQENTSNSTFSG